MQQNPLCSTSEHEEGPHSPPSKSSTGKASMVGATEGWQRTMPYKLLPHSPSCPWQLAPSHINELSCTTTCMAPA